mgnify:CR=1 FL=1
MLPTDSVYGGWASSGEIDILENTQMFQKALEEIVRQHPEQWFWMHRRWKGSPTVSYEKRKK